MLWVSENKLLTEFPEKMDKTRHRYVAKEAAKMGSIDRQTGAADQELLAIMATLRTSSSWLSLFIQESAPQTRRSIRQISRETSLRRSSAGVELLEEQSRG